METKNLLERKEYFIDGFKYLVVPSNQISDIEKKHFCLVRQIVFALKDGEKWFDNKYGRNIYGESIIVIVYKDNQPIATEALWRNDVYREQISYQSCDTSVLPEYRGQHIFLNMVDLATKHVENEQTYIYGFPNGNSLYGFEKLQWKVIARYRYKLLLFNKKKYLNELGNITEDYADWWFKSSSVDVEGIRICGRWFLARRKRNYVYSLIGEIDATVANKYPKAKKLIVFVKTTNATGLIAKKFNETVCISKGKQSELTNILFKCDAI